MNNRASKNDFSKLKFNLTAEESVELTCNSSEYIKTLKMTANPKSGYCMTTLMPQLLGLLDSRFLYNMCITTYQTEFITTLYNIYWFDNKKITLPSEVRRLIIGVLLKFNVRNLKIDKKLEEDHIMPVGYEHYRVDSALLDHFKFIDLLINYRNHPSELEDNKKALTMLIENWSRAENGNYTEIYKSREQAIKDHITRLALMRDARINQLKDTYIQKHLNDVQKTIKKNNNSALFRAAIVHHTKAY